jgi:hypothetical protein
MTPDTVSELGLTPHFVNKRTRGPNVRMKPRWKLSGMSLREVLVMDVSAGTLAKP